MNGKLSDMVNGRQGGHSNTHVHVCSTNTLTSDTMQGSVFRLRSDFGEVF